MPLQLNVTFQSGSYPYTVKSGVVRNNRLEYQSGDNSLIVRIDLPYPSDVTEVQFDWTNSQNCLVIVSQIAGPSLGGRRDIGTGGGTLNPADGYTKTVPINTYGEKADFVEIHLFSSTPGTILDNCRISYDFTVTVPINEGRSYCPIVDTANDDWDGFFPISLLKGEKREDVTDIQINSIGRILDFTRSYRQSKQAEYQSMGLGWLHNHAMMIDTSISSKLLLCLPGGGQAHFTQVDTSDLYAGDTGSNSQIDASGVGNSKYTLTASDTSKFIFDDQGRIRERRWVDDEVWTYNYYSSGYASGLLEEVDDGYGRKLQFSYIDNSGQFDHLQLWRVGDHTASGLDSGSPTGRYVEYNYTIEKDNGVEVSSGKALLTGVQDIRGENWLYDYYGQDSGENDNDQLNFLIEVISPSVDIDGDNNVDSPLTLKRLTYTLSNGNINAITQEQGIMGNQDALQKYDYTFQPGGQNITTEEMAERTLTHRFHTDANIYLGTDNNLSEGSEQSVLPSYRADKQIDANGNATYLGWRSDGKVLNSVTDDNNNTTSFTYDNEDRLSESVDAEDRKTTYTYGDNNNPRQATEIKVLDTDDTTVLQHQVFVYDTKGRTTSQELRDPNDGISVLQQTTRSYYAEDYGAPSPTDVQIGSRGMLHTLTQKDMDDPGGDQSTTYTYDHMGQVIKTHKSSLLGSCQFTYTVYDVAGNIIGSACSPHGTNTPTDTIGLLTLYDANDATKKHTRVTLYEYDSMGRQVQVTTNAGSSFARSSRTLYDALSRVTRQIENYVVQGSSAPGNWLYTNGQWEDGAGHPISHGNDLNENIINDTVYNARGLVRLRRDAEGRVTLYGYDDADRLVKTVQNASDATYDNDYDTATNLDGDPDLSAYIVGSSVEQDRITETAYDAAGNIIWAKDVRAAVTLTAYDVLNRPVKVIQNAAHPDYDLSADASLDNYVLSKAPDTDMVMTTEYDSMGRVVTTARLLENRDSEVWDVTRNVYDALGRQIRTVMHYVPQLDGASVETKPADWVFENGQWKQVANGTAIGHDSDTLSGKLNDINLITERVYDAQGRVLETIGIDRRRNRSVYDGLNRLVRSIQNYVVQGTSDPTDWVFESGQWKQAAAGTAIEHGVNLDQNIITETVYDSDGRVESMLDIEQLNSRRVYDAQGRQVKSIQNYIEQNNSNPLDWVWDATDTRWEQVDGTAIVREGSITGNDDINLIAATTYDAENRVLATRDVRGNVTRMVYDSNGRQVMTIGNFDSSQNTLDPALWVWNAINERWEDNTGAAIAHGSDNVLNLISTTTYDLMGRVLETRTVDGNVTRMVYDELGRGVMTIGNYEANSQPPENWLWDDTNARWEDGAGNAIEHSIDNDRNLISLTVYNPAGQVIQSRDARGTMTGFVYDNAGRQLNVIQAANTHLETRNYTCFDKAGRVLRTIHNYVASGISPDTWTNGIWDFMPDVHGQHQDRNIVQAQTYDAASRVIVRTDSENNDLSTIYNLNGTVNSMVDAAGIVTVYCYDALRRRLKTVQNYISNNEDPVLWVWDSNNSRYEKSDGTAIEHGTDNDENIIVQLTYNLKGRMTQMRDPRGSLTTYIYDALGRRVSLTNPLSKTWETFYTDNGHVTETTMKYPGLASGGSYDVTRKTDQLGRVTEIDYGAAATTPIVSFTYDLAGNRSRMTEHDGTSDVRITDYDYDTARRLKQVDIDRDADTIINDTVSYDYDLVGRRTTLTMPDNLSISYEYDAKGRLIALSDWDNQTSHFAYDDAGRHILTSCPNDMKSRYDYDTVGRLRHLRHSKDDTTLLGFEYDVDSRGNRTQAVEILDKGNYGTVTYAYNASELDLDGTWTDTSSFKVTDSWEASLRLLVTADKLILTYGTGPDHSIFDVYIGGTLYNSYNGYSPNSGEEVVTIPLTGDGLLLFEMKNRADRSPASSDYKMRFKTLQAKSRLMSRTIDYIYDDLSRLKSASYDGGTTYAYGYDLAGNMLDMNGTVRTFNSANQMTHDGTNNLTYDDNGNLTLHGTDTYVWDNANRLLSYGGTSYAYDGNSNRISQTLSSTVTEYLVDTQPGLSKVLRESDGTNTTHFVHAPHGIFSQYDGTDWLYTVQDALGSVRAMADATGAIQQAVNYSEYGVPNTTTTGFAFTGEQRDSNGLQYHRARYYDPQIGIWISRDPMETPNRYGYASGNPIMKVDPTGLFDWDNLRVDQYDTLSCIAAEGGIPINKFQEFVSIVQLFSLTSNKENLERLNPMPPESSFCAFVGGTNPIDRPPIIYPNCICIASKILIPDAIPGISNILQTGKQNSGRFCPGRSPVKPCSGTVEIPPVLGQTSEMIPLEGVRYFLDTSFTSIIQDEYKNQFGAETTVFDNLTLTLEWHRALNESNNAGWYANVAFVVNPTDFMGGSGGFGNIWGSVAEWPQKGDISMSRSYSVDFGVISLEDTISPNGDFTRFLGFSASVDALPVDDFLPLLTGGQGVGVSLYLGNGSSDLITALGLLFESDNWQKFTDIVHIVSQQSIEI